MATGGKFYKLDVTMTTGFKYSLVCIGRMLEGMKKSSGGHWTEKVEVTEITKEEYDDFYYRDVVEEKKPKVVTKKIPKATKADMEKLEQEAKKPKKRQYPQFSSLENFFGEEDGTERPNIPPAKKGRNKKADTQPKVRAKRGT